MTYTPFPKGSEWRKWDLHIHSPMSGLANEFPKKDDGLPDWDKYVEKLEALTDIPAIGITDYFLIEGYKKIREFKDAGRLKNISLVLPNIEFRLDNFVGDRRINFHVIFSDKVKFQDIEDHFLADIEIAIEGSPWSPGDTRKLKRSSLEQLGAKRKSEHLPFQNRSDFEIGCMTAVAKLDKIMEILTTNSLFKGQYITVLAEEKTSLMDWDGQDHGVRKIILQNSHAIFTTNPNSIDWYLGKKHSHPDDYVQEFKSLKPCAMGSDAHNIDSIGVPPNGKYTWIKADVTFDGLKQIICEPEDRVYIGSTPPDEKDNTKVIKALAIENGNGWFKDQTIEFNRDMVTIIGGKGSGKTALVDLLAYAGGDFDFLNEDAFLKKAEDEITGTKLTLTWEDGPTSSHVVHDRSSYPKEPKVRYLSQSFIEKLCSFDQHKKLVGQIENILFQYVPNDKKMSAKDFASLKEIKTRSIQLEVEQIETTLKKLNGEIFGLETEIAGKSALENERTRLIKEKTDLDAQKPLAASPEEQKEQELLHALREKKATIESAIETNRVKISLIEEFCTRAKILKAEVKEFNTEIIKHLMSWGWVLESNGADFIFTEPTRIDELLKGKILEIEESIKKLEGLKTETIAPLPSSDVAADTLASIERQIADLEAKSKLEVQRKRKLMEFSKRVSEITARITMIDKTIAALNTTKVQLLNEKVAERDNQYFDFFKKIEQKKLVLEELYKPLNEPGRESGERGKVEFYARFNFNTQRFVAEGLKLFDGRKSVIRGESGLTEVAEDFWKRLQKLLPDTDKNLLLNLFSKLETATDGKREVESQLRAEFNRSDVYNWLYCVNYFDVEYGIKHESVDLEKLSKGRKGVVLLLIYLDIDQDYRPLLIDQPEENLDNRSVYSTLVKYFKKAKKKRQIILVTHNANLVVNSDAEQVIVANFDLDKQSQSSVIEYCSGALEFRKKADTSIKSVLLMQGIREHVCEILEGGNKAFQQREHKYDFPHH